MFRRYIIGMFLLATLTGLIPLLPFAFPSEDSVSTIQPKLERFSSYEALVSFLSSSRYSAPYYSVDSWFETFSGSKNADFNSVSAPEYSKTNIQVEGVDEADIVKCDGEYMYLVSGGKVLIVKAYPPKEAGVVASLELKGTIRGIFVNRDRLIVITEESPYSIYGVDRGYVSPVKYWWFQTAIKVYDVENRSKPVLARNVSVDGGYFNSRMIGNYAYVLIRAQAYFADGEVPLPSIFFNGQAEKIEASSIYYSNVSDYSYVFTTVLAINVQNDEEEVVHETFLLGYASCIYVSLNDIYLTTPRYGEDGREKTEIHRIHIDKARITFEASGEVPGYVLNQFSMDEYDGHFRIATTTGYLARNFAESTSSNHVYVLNRNLTVVGKIEDLAPGEKIYSARFIGERCYLVTFKKVDPLFVISLEDPANPTVLGKLKIPGYSDYLHPYDKNHLIGIGKNTVEAEEGDFAWYQGVKISLFDVSDVDHPKETANFTIGDRGTDSPVLRDHKALLFDKERNLLVIPVLVAEIDEAKYSKGVPANAYGDYVWQGAYVFNITETNITLRGRITHMENSSDFLKSEYYFSSEYSVERAFYIDNVLYTISNNKIKMNNLTSLQEIGELELP